MSKSQHVSGAPAVWSNAALDPFSAAHYRLGRGEYCFDFDYLIGAVTDETDDADGIVINALCDRKQLPSLPDRKIHAAKLYLCREALQARNFVEFATGGFRVSEWDPHTGEWLQSLPRTDDTALWDHTLATEACETLHARGFRAPQPLLVNAERRIRVYYEADKHLMENVRSADGRERERPKLLRAFGIVAILLCRFEDGRDDEPSPDVQLMRRICRALGIAAQNSQSGIAPLYFEIFGQGPWTYAHRDLHDASLIQQHTVPNLTSETDTGRRVWFSMFKDLGIEPTREKLRADVVARGELFAQQLAKR